MEFSSIEAGSPAANQWQSVAERIAAIVRVSGLEVFRQAVRQVERERLEVEDKRKRREKARREALKKNGVLYRDGAVPEQAGDEWFFHLETLRSWIKLPPEISLPAVGNKDVIFEHVKQRGFPNEENGKLYEFRVCAGLPADLDPAKDPPHERLLPVPRRALTDVEKITVLAAVYDAHWRGSEKVAPWGVSENGDMPDAWPSKVKREDRKAAHWYHLLVGQAERLDPDDVPFVRSWIDVLPRPLRPAPCDVDADVLETSRTHTPRKRKLKRSPGPKGPRYDAAEDQGIYDGWRTWVKSGGARSVKAYARERHGATSRKDELAIERAIERVRKRRQRKGLK